MTLSFLPATSHGDATPAQPSERPTASHHHRAPAPTLAVLTTPRFLALLYRLEARALACKPPDLVAAAGLDIRIRRELRRAAA